MNLGGVLKAASLGVSVARTEAKAVIARAVTNAAFAAGVGILAIFAFAFGLATFTVWLAHEIGTVPALGYIALGFLVLTIIVFIVWRVSTREKKPPPRAESPLAAAFNDQPRRPGEEPPPGSAIGSLGVVALVGFLMARQIFRR